MIFRLTSSSLAGTLRKLVAVGTARLRSMLATISAPAPRMGLPTGAAAARRPLAAPAALRPGAGPPAPARRRRPEGAAERAGAATGAEGAGGHGFGGSSGSPRRSRASSRSPSRIAPVLLVHLLDQPGVRAEGQAGRVVFGPSPSMLPVVPVRHRSHGTGWHSWAAPTARRAGCGADGTTGSIARMRNSRTGGSLISLGSPACWRSPRAAAAAAARAARQRRARHGRGQQGRRQQVRQDAVHATAGKVDID